jgi:hypothetical protein
MLITTEVIVGIGGRNYQHYKDLGYKLKGYTPILVKIEHLSVGSHAKVNVICDYCGLVFEKVYKTLLLERENAVTKKDCCINCIHLKTRESNLELYGMENCMQRPDILEKLKNIFLEKYGVENPTQNKAVSEKSLRWMKEESSEEKTNRMARTKKTMMERYGVENGLLTEKSRRNLFIARSSESSQQKKLFNIIQEMFPDDKIFPNYSYSTLSLDILLIRNNISIDIEYDSWYWHSPAKDRKRDEFIKSEGFKVLRIKSGKKLPDKESLYKKIESLLLTDKKYSSLVLEDWNQEEYEKGGKRR